ncbi:MAG TPA: DUF99 family protein [Longimicrobiales bacterium]|nr:DUF99 family protein [Longimicrobiales bacterium]
MSEEGGATRPARRSTRRLSGWAPAARAAWPGALPPTEPGLSGPRSISHVIGIDDAPFDREHRGDVPIVGAVFCGSRLEGVLSGRVRRDGANAAREIARMIGGSRFSTHLQLVLLQGIALAGFNVVDVAWLHRALGVPVLVVARRQPDLEAMRDALLGRVRGGRRKWRLIERLGPMEPLAGVFVQRAGLSAAEAEGVIRRFAVHSSIPEPLRTAHLVAGGLARGESRGRV